MKLKFVNGAILLFVLCFGSSNLAKAEVLDRSSDHQALTQLKEATAKALSTRDVNLFKSLADENFTFTTVDGTLIRTIPDFQAYIDKLFVAKGAPLKNIEFHPKSDGPAQFLSDDTAINTGSSNDIYQFSNGKSKEMNSRWTAVAIRKQGQWKIASIHLSANILDNPIINTLKNKIYGMGIAGLLIGLVLGFLVKKNSSKGK